MKFNKAYLIFFLVTATLSMFMYGALSWTTYRTLLQKIDIELKAEANRIDHALSSLFEEIQSLMIFTGKRIAKLDLNNIPAIWEEINEVFGQKKSRIKTDWHVAWLNDKNIMKASATYGIYADFHDLSFRKYTTKSRQMPSHLHFDPPSLAVPSNVYSLNAGLGVVDDKGKFLGTLAAGFFVEDLMKQVKWITTEPFVSFAVYNEDSQMVLSSVSEASFLQAAPSLKQIADKARKIKVPQRSIPEEETALVSRFYVKNLSNFPFSVITYVDEKRVKKEWYRQLTPHLIELGCVTIAFFAIILILWKRFQKKNSELDATRAKLEYAFSLARASDAAKEEFLHRTNVEMVIPLMAIKRGIHLMRKNLNREVDTELPLERQIEIYDEILDHALDFKNLTNHVLNLTEVDIKKIVQECVTIHSKTIFDKGIDVQIMIPDHLPPLACDEIKIRQIIVGLISRAIRYSPVQEAITIVGSLQLENNRKYIQLVFEDRGFGLSEEFRLRIEENFDSTAEAVDPNFTLSTIERLVFMHRGELLVDNKQGKGTVVILRLPLFEAYGTDTNISKKITPFPL